MKACWGQYLVGGGGKDILPAPCLTPRPRYFACVENTSSNAQPRSATSHLSYTPPPSVFSPCIYVCLFIHTYIVVGRSVLRGYILLVCIPGVRSSIPYQCYRLGRQAGMAAAGTMVNLNAWCTIDSLVRREAGVVAKNTTRTLVTASTGAV